MVIMVHMYMYNRAWIDVQKVNLKSQGPVSTQHTDTPNYKVLITCTLVYVKLQCISEQIMNSRTLCKHTHTTVQGF